MLRPHFQCSSIEGATWGALRGAGHSEGSVLSVIRAAAVLCLTLQSVLLPETVWKSVICAALAAVGQDTSFAVALMTANS